MCTLDQPQRVTTGASVSFKTAGLLLLLPPHAYAWHGRADQTTWTTLPRAAAAAAAAASADIIIIEFGRKKKKDKCLNSTWSSEYGWCCS